MVGIHRQNTSRAHDIEEKAVRHCRHENLPDFLDSPVRSSDHESFYDVLWRLQVALVKSESIGSVVYISSLLRILCIS